MRNLESYNKKENEHTLFQTVGFGNVDSRPKSTPHTSIPSHTSPVETKVKAESYMSTYKYIEKPLIGSHHIVSQTISTTHLLTDFYGRKITSRMDLFHIDSVLGISLKDTLLDDITVGREEKPLSIHQPISSSSSSSLFLFRFLSLFLHTTITNNRIIISRYVKTLLTLLHPRERLGMWTVSNQLFTLYDLISYS